MKCVLFKDFLKRQKCNPLFLNCDFLKAESAIFSLERSEAVSWDHFVTLLSFNILFRETRNCLYIFNSWSKLFQSHIYLRKMQFIEFWMHYYEVRALFLINLIPWEYKLSLKVNTKKCVCYWEVRSLLISACTSKVIFL